DWAEGFLQAIMLRMDAWDRLLKSKRDGQLLIPILALCGDENGESLLGLPAEDEDPIMQEAVEFIPACVTAIAAYWRRKGPKQISMPLIPSPSSVPHRSASKAGRNDPCPCGSGKKFKKAAGTPTEERPRHPCSHRMFTKSSIIAGFGNGPFTFLRKRYFRDAFLETAMIVEEELPDAGPSRQQRNPRRSDVAQELARWGTDNYRLASYWPCFVCLRQVRFPWLRPCPHCHEW